MKWQRHLFTLGIPTTTVLYVVDSLPKPTKAILFQKIKSKEGLLILIGREALVKRLFFTHLLTTIPTRMLPTKFFPHPKAVCTKETAKLRGY